MYPCIIQVQTSLPDPARHPIAIPSPNCCFAWGHCWLKSVQRSKRPIRLRPLWYMYNDPNWNVHMEPTPIAGLQVPEGGSGGATCIC